MLRDCRIQVECGLTINKGALTLTALQLQQPLLGRQATRISNKIPITPNYSMAGNN